MCVSRRTVSASCIGLPPDGDEVGPEDRPAGRAALCRGMDVPLHLPGYIAWLVDEAVGSPSPDGFLTELGGRLLADGVPLAGGALTLAVPHPIIVRRTWLWRGGTGGGVGALGFAGRPPRQAGGGRVTRVGPQQGGKDGPGAGGAGAGGGGARPV